MRLSRSSIAVVLGLLATAAVGVPATVDATTTPTIRAHLVRPGVIRYTHTAAIHGVVQVGGVGDPGVSVTLRVDSYPFDGYRDAATAVTDAQGDFTFRVRPSRNTNFRVAGPSSSVSNVVRAIVLPDFSTTSNAPSTVIHAHVTLHYPPGVSETHQPVYWYLALNGAQRARFQKTTFMPKPVRPGWTKFTVSLPTGLAPGVGYRYRYELLYRDRPTSGIGLRACVSHLRGDHHPLGHRSCKHPMAVHFKPWS